MTEAERINLYNDLCDYELELRQIVYPNKTREVDIIHRAVQYVRGNQARWVTRDALPVLNDKGNIVKYTSAKCSFCGFASGDSDYKFCPNCASRMVR